MKDNPKLKIYLPFILKDQKMKYKKEIETNLNKCMGKKPIISVVIATYNRAHILPRAINSVLNQTYKNFELIIIDDCSTDNTQEIVKSFSDKRIIYHRHKKNKGLLAAINTGWNLTEARYNCKLDDDDELFPKALETVVKKFNEFTPKGIKFLWFNSIDAETGEYSGSGINKEGYISYEDILSNKIHGDYWQVVDMEFLGETRYDEKWWGGGGILWLKLLHENKAYFIPEVLYKAYREHGKRMTIDRSSLLEHLPQILLLENYFFKEHGEELKRLCPKRYGEKLKELGFYQILSGKIIKGRKTLIESFKFNFSIMHYILFILSFVISYNQIKSIYIHLLNIR